MKNSVLGLVLTGLLIFSIIPALADEGKKDNPEAKSGPHDNPEKKAENPDKPGNAKPQNNSKEAKVFAAYDKDKDGKVTDKEVSGMREGKLSSSQKREIRKEVKSFDKDKDGSLSLKEFSAWRNRNQKKEK